MIGRCMYRHACVLTLALLLGGCATLVPPADTGPSDARTISERQYAETIDLGGRLSLRYQANGKEEAVHGSYLWEQSPSQTNVTLLSPLGQTIAVIAVTPEGASLAKNGQAPRIAADVDALVAHTLGWPLPVSGLREWLQGFGIDAAGNQFVATPKASEVTTQDGWRIRYAAWQDGALQGEQSRPRRVDLERQTAQAGAVSMRIVIDKWQPGRPQP